MPKIQITIHEKRLNGESKKKLDNKSDPLSLLIQLLARQAAKEHTNTLARKRRRKIQKIVREAKKNNKSE